MKRIKLILTLTLMFVTTFALVGCTQVEGLDLLGLAQNEINLDSQVTADFTVPTSLSYDWNGDVYEITIAWASDNAAIAISDANATVTRPEHGDANAEVTLTATLSYEELTLPKEIEVVVLALPADEQDVVDAAQSQLELGLYSTNISGNFLLSEKEFVTFESELFDVDVAWASDNAAISISDGEATVIRPGAGESNEAVTLTATLSYGTATATKTFNVSVLAADPMAPTLSGIVYHWMEGALAADVTADIDLKGAAESSVSVYYGSQELVADVDFEVYDGEFTLFGVTLDLIVDGVGSYWFVVASSFGSSGFEVIVVDDPTGTSIPTHETTGINMSAVANYTPTSVITGAPDLLITEVVQSTTGHLYDYIEVFNNTDAVYNLQGHRIVYTWSDYPTRQWSFDTNGTLQSSYAMISAFIYQDVEIPALSSATIWVLTQTSHKVDGTTREAYEFDSSVVFEGVDSNVTMEKFKAYHQLGETDIVAPAVQNYMLVNGTYAFNEENGLGAAIMKGGTYWTMSSAYADRVVQIQKLDTDTYFSVDVDEAAWDYSGTNPAFFRYEWGVINTVEEVYTDGVFDSSKVMWTGTPGEDPLVGSSTWRQSVNAFYARKVYYDASYNLLGYGKAGAQAGIDAYNYSSSDTTAYSVMYANAVTAVVSAYMMPDVVEGEGGVLETAGWTDNIGLEYTLPVAGVHPFTTTLMRFIPRIDKTAYLAVLSDVSSSFSGYQYLLDAVAESVNAVQKTQTIIVPDSPAYPMTYLASAYNTSGKQGEYNFIPVTPAS